MDIQAYSTASGLDLSLQSALVRGHTDNISPPVCWFLIIPGHSDLK